MKPYPPLTITVQMDLESPRDRQNYLATIRWTGLGDGLAYGEAIEGHFDTFTGDCGTEEAKLVLAAREHLAVSKDIATLVSVAVGHHSNR